MLTDAETLLIAIIIAFFVLLFTTRLKIELIAVLVLLALSFSGLVTPEQALSGFSSSVVITLIGLFIITNALEETGVVQWIAARLNRIGQGSEVKLITLFMFSGAAMSLIMNNVAAGAVLLPAAVQVARASKIPVSRLLMPMSFGTLVGGMATYLTTANIVMSELLQNRGLDGLTMIDFLPTGSLIVLAGLVYMLLIGRHLLPERETLSQTLIQQPDLEETYRLDERFWQVRVPPDSDLDDRTLAEIGIGEQLGLTVVTIWRGQETLSAPGRDQVIRAGDRLLVIGRQERLAVLLEWGAELIEEAKSPGQLAALPEDTIEIVIAPRADAIGKSLTGLKFRETFGALVVALWRESRSYRTDVGKMPLQVGDALLVLGRSGAIQTLVDARDYIVPGEEYTFRSFRPEKAPFALLITAAVLTVAILDLLPLPLMMLTGAALMVMTGCLEMEEFYNAVEWRVIFLVAGMLPLSIAIADTGLADRVGTLMVDALAGYSPLVLMAGMVVLTMLVVQIIGGQIAALLVGPIAINAALLMNINPQTMSIAVAMACSMAFLTPIAHPVNILMMGPGGYEFGDFFKVGIGMTLVTLVTMIPALAIIQGI